MILSKNPKALVLADQAIFSGTGFLMTILVARHLNISDFGEYSSIVLLTYLAISTISAWTIQVFQVTTDRSTNYISFIFWAQIILLIIFVMFLKISLYAFSFHFLNSTLLFGMGFVMYDFSRKMFLALDKTFAALILDAITSFLMILAFFIFQHQGSKNVSEMLLYFSWVYSISLLYTIYVVRPSKLNTSTSKSFIIRHINHGKWLFFTALSQWWAGNLFVVASGIYLGAAALGALRLGQSLFGILNVLLQTFENYVLPQTALKMQKSHSLGIAYLKEMNLKLAYAFMPVLLIIFIFAEPILIMAGGKNYTEYAFVLKGLSILYIFILISQPIRFFFRSMQMNSHFFYAYFISLVFALATSHWLLSSYGLEGVIAGLIGSQTLLMTYWLIILQLKNINIWKSSTLC